MSKRRQPRAHKRSHSSSNIRSAVLCGWSVCGIRRRLIADPELIDPHIPLFAQVIEINKILRTRTVVDEQVYLIARFSKHDNGIGRLGLYDPVAMKKRYAAILLVSHA
jgi:hypothetical protein